MVVYFAPLGLGSFSLSGEIVNSHAQGWGFCWIAVKELLSSYYIGEPYSILYIP